MFVVPFFGDFTRIDDVCVVGPLLPVLFLQLPPPNALEKTSFIKSIMIIVLHRFFCSCFWYHLPITKLLMLMLIMMMRYIRRRIAEILKLRKS